ncbi:MAG: cytochrome c oxidase subunit II [Gammaproteobacteria bacterium]|nr:cytochrome c oxidase subunit II [Gammaproteobacteria bacterium]
MSSILPPAQRIWWKVPVGKSEIIWVVLALIWCLIMFVMMPYWHVYGKQNLSNEAYRIEPSDYAAKVQAMVDQHTARMETFEVSMGEAKIKKEIPVVKPPAGSDVYLLGRLWEWWPILELEKDQEYRLHISSLDWQHGFSLQPDNINMQILPGYDMVLTITPDRAGDYSIICNEYCGINHHTMTGKIYVK